jgi:hypothetical protein
VIRKNPGLGFSIAGGVGSTGYNPYRRGDTVSIIHLLFVCLFVCVFFFFFNSSVLCLNVRVSFCSEMLCTCMKTVRVVSFAPV